MEDLAKLLIPGVLFLLILIFGFWLSKVGRPYNGLLFNAHKLIALGAVVVAAIQLTKTLLLANASGLVIALLVVAAICILALFASGALLSADKLNYFVMRAIHNIAFGVMVLVLVVLIYQLTQTP